MEEKKPPQNYEFPTLHFSNFKGFKFILMMVKNIPLTNISYWVNSY